MASEMVESSGADASSTASETVVPSSKPFGPVLAASLWIHAGPCIFVVGLIGNVCVLLVMSQRRMRGTSTCVYLRWMAVADLCVLVSGMITEWVEALFDVTFKVESQAEFASNFVRREFAKNTDIRIFSFFFYLEKITSVTTSVSFFS